MEGPGVEDHAEDDDLADEDDGHQVSVAVKTDGHLRLKLEHGVILIFGLINFLVFFS